MQFLLETSSPKLRLDVLGATEIWALRRHKRGLLAVFSNTRSFLDLFGYRGAGYFREGNKSPILCSPISLKDKGIFYAAKTLGLFLSSILD